MGSAGTILVIANDAGVPEAPEIARVSPNPVQMAAPASTAPDAVTAHPSGLILLDTRLDLPGTSVLHALEGFPSSPIIPPARFGSHVLLAAHHAGWADRQREKCNRRDAGDRPGPAARTPGHVRGPVQSQPSRY